jgi:hypothetical protein
MDRASSTNDLGGFTMIRRMYLVVVCRMFGHVVNENCHWDELGTGMDGVSFCERCGDYDV